MNRRAILAILTGSAASVYPGLASTKTGDSRPPAVASPSSGQKQTNREGEKIGQRTSGFPDLKAAGVERHVQSIAHSQGAYKVTTAAGGVTYFLEADLRFKIDSSDLGPQEGKPVIVPSGTEGDRAWVIFASPREIAGFVTTEPS